MITTISYSFVFKRTFQDASFYSLDAEIYFIGNKLYLFIKEPHQKTNKFYFFCSAFCGCWFNLQWGKSCYTRLIRPNKVETAVQCFHMSHTVFAGFSGHGNSIYKTHFPYITDLFFQN